MLCVPELEPHHKRKGVLLLYRGCSLHNLTPAPTRQNLILCSSNISASTGQFITEDSNFLLGLYSLWMSASLVYLNAENGMMFSLSALWSLPTSRTVLGTKKIGYYIFFGCQCTLKLFFRHPNHTTYTAFLLLFLKSTNLDSLSNLYM